VTSVAKTVLYRPVGAQELELGEQSGWARFPPRLPDQPIFYPVENEAYATQIARDWKVKSSGAGFVLRFAIETAFLSITRCNKSAPRRIANTGYPPKTSKTSTITSSARSS
jgi:hypothetical protein